MGLRFDPPDFIDSGSTSATDAKGLFTNYGSLALGTAGTVVAIGAGMMMGDFGKGIIGRVTGLDMGSSSDDNDTVWGDA